MRWEETLHQVFLFAGAGGLTSVAQADRGPAGAPLRGLNAFSRRSLKILRHSKMLLSLPRKAGPKWSNRAIERLEGQVENLREQLSTLQSRSPGTVSPGTSFITGPHPTTALAGRSYRDIEVVATSVPDIVTRGLVTLSDATVYFKS